MDGIYSTDDMKNQKLCIMLKNDDSITKLKNILAEGVTKSTMILQEIRYTTRWKRYIYFSNPLAYDGKVIKENDWWFTDCTRDKIPNGYRIVSLNSIKTDVTYFG